LIWEDGLRKAKDHSTYNVVEFDQYWGLLPDRWHLLHPFMGKPLLLVYLDRVSVQHVEGVYSGRSFESRTSTLAR